ncbi:hypothetical protein [Pontivivens ytuae]|uniref:Uncharacterized protein n=1 Tax=Pontivivens ytuae TaxID=2789856 RepID=A0A7S9LTE3_9RHOB|nr:hypothetical protein [Pontivivens ytuae]QPH54944.1 hypothetical protein I0K15_04045 [Pontivivens ytuae]
MGHRPLLQAALLMLAALLAPGAEAQTTSRPDTGLDRARAGAFDAQATIRCAQEVGEALGDCAAGVAHGEWGHATVVVTFPNGFRRILFFAEGTFDRGNPTMSGVGTDTSWSLTDGVHVIRVDDQRFEIPDAFVFPDEVPRRS